MAMAMAIARKKAAWSTARATRGRIVATLQGKVVIVRPSGTTPATTSSWKRMRSRRQRLARRPTDNKNRVSNSFFQLLCPLDQSGAQSARQQNQKQNSQNQSESKKGKSNQNSTNDLKKPGSSASQKHLGTAEKEQVQQTYAIKQKEVSGNNLPVYQPQSKPQQINFEDKKSNAEQS